MFQKNNTDSVVNRCVVISTDKTCNNSLLGISNVIEYVLANPYIGSLQHTLSL